MIKQLCNLCEQEMQSSPVTASGTSLQSKTSGGSVKKKSKTDPPSVNSYADGNLAELKARIQALQRVVEEIEQAQARKAAAEE